MQRHQEKPQQAMKKRANTPMLLDVRIRQTHRDCPRYRWDRGQGCLRFAGIHHATPGLPADLAVLLLEGQTAIPMLLLTTHSIAPDTVATARLLGAFCILPHGVLQREAPLADATLVAVAVDDETLSTWESLELLPSAQREALQQYVQRQRSGQQHEENVVCVDASTAAQQIREARLLLKRQQRANKRSEHWRGRNQQEHPVAWRAVEELPAALRLQIQQDHFLSANRHAPHAQAEQLLRSVPQRFQEALSHLLLDDERLLVFIERPLLAQSKGLFGRQTGQAHEGLLLLTDSQLLWVRDFFASRTDTTLNGYIAHSLPLARLARLALLPAEQHAATWMKQLTPQTSPYQRVVWESASGTGSEVCAIAFPVRAELDDALKRLLALAQGFLPAPAGTSDQRVRRLPSVEPYQPQGAERTALEGLGGSLSVSSQQRLEEHLTAYISSSSAALLTTALVPALEEYHSPARIVALTRQALLVFDEQDRTAQQPAVQRHAYALQTLSSVQLRSSLLGASLSLCLPQTNGTTTQIVLPFHSPALALFLPLFTRLRLLLNTPCMTNESRHEKG